MKLKSLMLAAAALICALPSGAIDIIDLHQNTSTGVASLLGQEVTVSGIITVPGGVYSTYSFEVYLQDATAGVNLYVSGGLGTFEAELGDSVTVTAPVAQYAGLTELGTAIGDVTFTNHGPAVSFFPDTLVMTCAEALATFQGDYSEPNESRLIRVNGVSIEDGTWPTVPGGSSRTMRSNSSSDGPLLGAWAASAVSPAAPGVEDTSGGLSASSRRRLTGAINGSSGSSRVASASSAAGTAESPFPQRGRMRPTPVTSQPARASSSAARAMPRRPVSRVLRCVWVMRATGLRAGTTIGPVGGASQRDSLPRCRDPRASLRACS